MNIRACVHAQRRVRSHRRRKKGVFPHTRGACAMSRGVAEGCACAQTYAHAQVGFFFF
ncbi:uncharacterized protein DS421_18g627670 [Arachis hypogaea]|nr:uncharacterized protein DS421_18g627670 [Arachis hypogaea]